MDTVRLKLSLKCFFRILLAFLAFNPDGIKAQFLKLDLHRHQGCNWRKSSSWNRKLEFEGGQKNNGARLKTNFDQPGCYSIQGNVKIHEDMEGELLIYLAVSTSGDAAQPPDICRDANNGTGCGGVGSCLYCRPCESLGALSRVLGAELIVDGKVAGCQPLKRGIYDNVELRFCLPELQKILAWQGISEKAIDHIIAASSLDGNGLPRLSLFVTVYVFDKDVRPLLVSQRRLEQKIRKMRHIEPEEQLDSATYWSLPFNQMLKKQQKTLAEKRSEDFAKELAKLFPEEDFPQFNKKAAPSLQKVRISTTSLILFLVFSFFLFAFLLSLSLYMQEDSEWYSEWSSEWSSKWYLPGPNLILQFIKE